MNAYENLKASFLSNVSDKMPNIDSESLLKIANALDESSVGFSIVRETTDLIVGNNSFPDEVKQYIVSKKVEGRSEETLKNRNLCYQLFFSSVRKPVREITTNDIRMYLYKYQTNRHISDRSLEQIRSSLSALWQWMFINDMVDKNVVSNICPIKYEKKQRLAMSQYELEIFRQACSNERETAVVEFLYSTGCRVAELTNVKIQDIDWNNSTVMLLGKGKKQRIGYMNPKCIISIKKFLENRNYESEYLFASHRAPHGKITTAAVEKTIRNIRNRTSSIISKPISPHILRHTTATIAYKGGMPIEQISKMLGHSSIDVTKIYSEIDNFDVASSHNKFVI